MHIILHQPEIPANTGNIGRTCVATGTSLHLIEPLGFRLNEKEIKRAGMDYWQHLDVTRYMNFQEFQEMHPGAKIWMATTKAHQTYTDVSVSLCFPRSVHLTCPIPSRSSSMRHCGSRVLQVCRETASCTDCTGKIRTSRKISSNPKHPLYKSFPQR